MEEKKLEEKKIALKKFDPALTAVALGEVLMAKRIEKADVAMAKEKITLDVFISSVWEDKDDWPGS